MSDSKNTYNIGDPVWSKMKGYCPWPSRIAAPHESSLKNNATDKLKSQKVHYLVYFFGSNNFAWMAEDTIKPYEQHKEKNVKGAKTSQFKAGLKQIEEYIKNGGKATLVAAQSTSDAAIKNNTIKENSSSPNWQNEDSLSNDASNPDGDLPSIDEEIAAIHNKKPTSSSATSAKRSKNSHDSHNDSSSLTSPVPSSVQKDYSRTPFKSRKAARSGDGDSLAPQATSPSKRLKTSDDSVSASSLSSPTISTAITSTTSSSRPPTAKFGARNVLLRATQYLDVPATETPRINMSSVSAKARTIKASNLKFGFIGLGFMGQRLLKNLLDSGHKVTVWNRSPEKCKEFVEAGASQAKTPGDVVTAADVVFSCLSDPKASKEIVYGPFGVLTEINDNKGLVEMSSIDPETSNDISEAIIGRGGRYLEAPPIGNGKRAADDGELTIVAAGDKSLYEDCSSCFNAMAKKTIFLGQVGCATKMNLITSMLYGTMVGALTECCAMVEVNELNNSDFRDILKLSIMNNPLIERTMDKLLGKDQAPDMPLEHLQKDLRLAMNLSEEKNQTCPITATTNEIFKNAIKFGHGYNDASSVFQRYRY